jgi:hypothetical protein
LANDESVNAQLYSEDAKMTEPSSGERRGWAPPDVADTTTFTSSITWRILK